MQHTTNTNLKTVLNRKFKKNPQAIHFILMICLSSLELERERNRKTIKSKKKKIIRHDSTARSEWHWKNNKIKFQLWGFGECCDVGVSSLVLKDGL